MGKKLYIGNLPFSVTDDSLKQAFTEAGQVVSAKVITDRASGRSKGFGFVEMHAIILRTIEDFNSGGELKEEALGYMLAEEEEYVFSFRAICRHLGFDPQKTYYQIANATRRISTRRRAV